MAQLQPHPCRSEQQRTNPNTTFEGIYMTMYMIVTHVIQRCIAVAKYRGRFAMSLGRTQILLGLCCIYLHPTRDSSLILH